MARPITILSIAGSDNSAGAGIQADIKTCSSLNAYCLTALTCITSQNSNSFSAETESIFLPFVLNSLTPCYLVLIFPRVGW